MNQHAGDETRPSFLGTLTLAAWGGLLFGVTEGILLLVSRRYPVLRAPYKVSEDILWIAPLLDAIIFAILGVGVLLLSRMLRLRHARTLFIIIMGITFLGAFATMNTLGLLHRWSVLVLAAGITVAIAGRVKGREVRVVEGLRRRAVLLPVLLIVLFVSAQSWNRGREALLVNRLPALTAGMANVLYIILDTVRRDSLEGEGSSPLPTFNALAAGGVRYTDAWAASSWSLPSHATLLTGRYASEHQADWPGLTLASEYSTLPEALAARGYVTAAFTGNANWMTPEYLGRGFHRFNAYTLEQMVLRTSLGRVLGDAVLKPMGIHPAGRGKRAPQLASEMLAFLDDHPERPWFAYMTFMDVNQTFHRRRFGHFFWERPASAEDVRRAYDEGLRQLDSDLGALLAELRARGALENTVVVVTSDHGESFGTRLGDHDPAGHGSSLYPEQTRVPLVVHYPRSLPGPVTVGTTVSLRAIPATIASLVGMPTSGFGEPLPVSRSVDPGEALMTLRYDDTHSDAIASEGWQLIRTLNDGKPVDELLDLRAEHTPVGTDSVMAHLRNRLAGHADTHAQVR